ncbi:hypothetical protein N2152v2_000283 [Parachlorella kessleri]
METTGLIMTGSGELRCRTSIPLETGESRLLQYAPQAKRMRCCGDSQSFSFKQPAQRGPGTLFPCNSAPISSSSGGGPAPCFSWGGGNSLTGSFGVASGGNSFTSSGSVTSGADCPPRLVFGGFRTATWGVSPFDCADGAGSLGATPTNSDGYNAAAGAGSMFSSGALEGRSAEQQCDAGGAPPSPHTPSPFGTSLFRSSIEHLPSLQVHQQRQQQQQWLAVSQAPGPVQW